MSPKVLLKEDEEEVVVEVVVGVEELTLVVTVVPAIENSASDSLLVTTPYGDEVPGERTATLVGGTTAKAVGGK